MIDTVHHAEIFVGYRLPRVAVGSFPNPPDLTAGRVQRIDIADILAIEGGARGSGLAAVFHEIEENYHAHSLPVVPHTSRLDESHREGIVVGGAVASQLVNLTGSRVAQIDVPISNGRRRILDFQSYYLVFDVTETGADRSVSNARRVGRVTVSSGTIDSFLSNSAVVPPTGTAAVGQVITDLAANPTATVRIEGFTDGVNTSAFNVPLSLHRAERARDIVNIRRRITGERERERERKRFHIVDRGATGFVAPNDTEANRALNRRVVITVYRPAL